MLAVKQVESAKTKDKPYRLSDGNGLYLYVPISGIKVWQMRYHFLGKEKIYTLGKVSNITLQNAREKAFELKKELLNGVDISKSKLIIKSENKNTFFEIFKEWYAFKHEVWSERYRKEIKNMFESDILPLIGNRVISEIKPMELVNIIRLFENRGAMERASKARRRCGEVFRYAIVTGRAKYNPAPDLVDAERGYIKKHYPFLTESQIPEFNRALLSFSGSIISRIATQVLQYTALRTKDLRSITWENVNFNKRIITIAHAVMKNRKDHIVPMSDQVYNLLKHLEPITKSISHFVSAGRNSKHKPISENTVLGVIRYIGFDGIASGHGFRHQFSTILNEHGFNKDLIERQLAHVDRNNIRGIYNHAQYLEKRKEMMQWFAEYIDQITTKNDLTD
ncbi:tyrosine-type recombinase/integrase [Candidatus Arsenophonus triatominarum]|uniref:tyrosine-type recombinase/integrase n=1 Tax=Candidatus Arsenophonus triatominarum TaxID=57911 RepID=UPI0007C4A406|nr:tyrosine-type recombinase/integrase [Candidatus Arsenophonus triatominarum]